MSSEAVNIPAPASESASALENPYVGLRAFEEEDFEIFFGRSEHSKELVSRLKDCRFVAVIGTSGSGKSSLVRAGLIPRLKAGRMFGRGSNWIIGLFRPEGQPIRKLAEALLRAFGEERFGTFLPPEAEIDALQNEIRDSSLGLVDAVMKRIPAGTNLLLVVDQFEELFRYGEIEEDQSPVWRRLSTGDSNTLRLQIAKEDESEALVRRLLKATRSEEQSRGGPTVEPVPIYVLLTMRSEFLGECTRMEDLPEAINQGLYLIPRLSRTELASAIQNPLAVKSGSVSEPLVQRLLNDIGKDHDQLPVLQHALMRAWQVNEHITSEVYDSIGGTARALSQHADKIWNGLPDDRSRETAERLFRALTKPGPDEQGLRRPARFGRICRTIRRSPEEVCCVIDAFRASGRALLMPPAKEPIHNKTFIDLSHEALIRKWERLRTWVEDERQSAQAYRRLVQMSNWKNLQDLPESEVRDFLRHRRRNYWNADWATRYGSPDDYAKAIKFLGDQRRGLHRSRVEKNRLDQLGRLREKELAETERKQRQRRLILKAIKVSFGAFVGLMILFIFLLYSNAKDAYAYSKKGAHQALLQRALADNTSPLERRRSVVAAYTLDSKDPKFENPNFWQQFSANSQDLTLNPVHAGLNQPSRLAVSPNGRLSVVATADGQVDLFLADPKTRTWSIENKRTLHSSQIRVVAFSADGSYFMLGGEDGNFDVYQTPDQRDTPVNVYFHSDGHGTIFAATFTRSGHLALVTKKGIEVLSLSAKKFVATELLPLNKEIWAGTFSQKGDQLLIGFNDKSVLLYNLTFAPTAHIRRFGKNIVSKPGFAAIGFQRDGKRFVIAETDGFLTFYNSTLSILKRGQLGIKVSALAFSPADEYLAVGTQDNALSVYDIEDLFRHSDTGNHWTQDYVLRVPLFSSVLSLAFDPSSAYIAVGIGTNDARAPIQSGSLRVIRTVTGSEVVRIDRPFSVNDLAFVPNAPDSGLLFAGSDAYVGIIGIQKHLPLEENWTDIHCNSPSSAIGEPHDTWAYACKSDLYVPGLGKAPVRTSEGSVIANLTFSQSGRYLAWTESRASDERLFVGRLDSNLERLAISEPQGCPRPLAIAFDPSESRVGCISDSAGLAEYRVDARGAAPELIEIRQPISETDLGVRTTAVAYGGGGVWAKGKTDGTIDVSTGVVLHTLNEAGHPPRPSSDPTYQDNPRVLALSFSKDNSLLAASTPAQTLVFDLTQSHPVRKYPAAALIAFSADATYLATAVSNVLQVFDLEKPAEKPSSQIRRMIEGGVIQAIGFETEKNLIITSTANRRWISTHSVRISTASIEAAVCRSIPKEQRKYEDQDWRNNGLFTNQWFGLVGPTKQLCEGQL